MTVPMPLPQWEALWLPLAWWKPHNEVELASDLAHEIGHIASRHSVEQMEETAIARGVATAAGFDRNTAVQIGGPSVQRPQPAGMNLKQDRRGLQILGRWLCPIRHDFIKVTGPCCFLRF